MIELGKEPSSQWCIFRAIYRAVVGVVRTRSPDGVTHYSKTFEITRGVIEGSGLVIAFNSNRSDEESGQSEDRLQLRGPSRTNGSPGRGKDLPEPF